MKLNPKLAEMQLRAEKQRALVWLDNLSKKTPLGRYLKGCLICGKDSDGGIRCKKHQKEYNEVFFASTQEFLKVFGDQL